MTRGELEALNSELIDLLIALRDRIEEKLEEIAAVDEEEEGAEDSEDEE